MKIPLAVFLLIALGLFFGSIFFFAERTPLRWLALFGCTVFFLAKNGQTFTSRRDRIANVFSTFSQVGLLTVLGGLIFKGLLIIRQQFVYVAGKPAHGIGAIVQGIFLIILALVLAFYALKHMKW